MLHHLTFSDTHTHAVLAFYEMTDLVNFMSEEVIKGEGSDWQCVPSAFQAFFFFQVIFSVSEKHMTAEPGRAGP